MCRFISGLASVLSVFLVSLSVTADENNSPRVTKVFSLKHASGEQVAPLLQSLYLVVDQQNAYARFQFDRRTDSLIVAASEPHHKQVATIIGLIDTPDKTLGRAIDDEESEQQIRGYPIKHVDGDSAASVLRSLFLVVNHRVAYARFAFDARTRSLIVVASESHHKQIAEVLKLLDTEAQTIAQTVDDDEAKQSVRTYSIKHVDGEQLMAKLRSHFVVVNHRVAPIRFGFDERTHSLIVIGDGAWHARVRDTIAVVDRPAER